ncbi:MAG: type III secretion inner membrane ring lipoprotein SctJ [Cocleimonas sp.]|nr:type III secretion inner membrane ring lipoprotein SctJ [Cocleimonas sp.]
MKNNISWFKKLRLFVVIGMMSLFVNACQMELYGNLSENDVNNMLSIMLSNDIDAKKMIDKKTKAFILMIDEGKIPEAISLLREHGYPREKVTGVEELFKKEGLVSSPMEERIRYIYALSQSVQETLSQIDGVLTARVHIVMPANNPFVDVIKPSSASVFIKYHPASDIRNIKSKIKLIVEKSIEGLSYEKVSVVMLPAQLSYSSNSR